MIILQATKDASWDELNTLKDDFYKDGVKGLILLPEWINLVAITDFDCSNIKILPKDDDL